MNIAFIIDFPESYKGGINYYKNLFFALNKYYSNELQIFVFVPSSFSEETLSFLKPNSRIIQTKVLKRYSLFWLFNKLTNKILKTDIILRLLLIKHRINIVSLCFSYYYLGKKIKVINWIPDFQSLHYPNLFTGKQLLSEKNILNIVLKISDVIVLSSFDALKDLNFIKPKHSKKVEVVHFVSQPIHFNSLNDIYSKRDFFYMPNQFWEHKNHITVFKAINELKKRKVNVLLICSGLIKDFRGRGAHLNLIYDYLDKNKLSNNIKILGTIPYEQVFQLISESIAVINPSFFEGWSSTVEESKTMGKRIILSDIPVHREQNPRYSYFFNPNSFLDLADIMENILKLDNRGLILNNYDQNAIDLENRTYEFAYKYKSILDGLVQNLKT